MPPALSANLAVSAFCKEHLSTALAPCETAGGVCHPPTAQARLLALAGTAAASVPAYATLLSEAAAAAGEGPAKGQDQAPEVPTTVEALPLTTKDNYHRRFPLPERCAGGGLGGAADFAHCSSGSSGAPTWWVRNAWEELAVCARFEQAFGDSFEALHRSTLAVVAFPLGSWVGGLFTTLCLRYLTLKGYRLTTVTPGGRAALGLGWAAAAATSLAAGRSAGGRQSPRRVWLAR